MSVGKLVTQLQDADQDFEFYPTTDEIIQALIKDVKSVFRSDYRNRMVSSVLDIGAGHGKVLRALKAATFSANEYGNGGGLVFGDLYAIEKSTILCKHLDPEVFIVGTDLMEQSLVTKQVGIIFCNPPYSQFVEWAVKIIRESAAPLVYLVIPKRWKDSDKIKEALKFRDGKFKTIGEFSFEDAEDRTARAQVNLIRIELSQEKDDAFDRFFNEQFGGFRQRFAEPGEDGLRKDAPADVRERVIDEKGHPKFRQLVVGANYPERLVALYNEEIAKIQKNYELVAQLDVDLLREFDVTPARILGCLKARLAGLKNLYWNELFSRMSQVTDRITSKRRRRMLETLQAHCHVDFTLGNIHAVVIWVLKNANQNLDEQLLEVFDDMVEKANVRNYVSNTRVFLHDRWRYKDGDKPSHIALEYRMVLQHCGGFCREYSRSGLNEEGCQFLGDLMTVARNLGFLCHTTDNRVLYNYGGNPTWQLGKPQTFYCTVDGDREILFEARAFLNRNIHIRINQKFALALNVEVGRLRGWLKSGQDAIDELKNGKKENDELVATHAAKYFGRNVQLGTTSLPALGYGPPPVAPVESEQAPAEQTELAGVT